MFVVLDKFCELDFFLCGLCEKKEFHAKDAENNTLYITKLDYPQRPQSH
ncbi:MAG: hypothetical protein N2319_07295 [Candidatus Kapabacteria bacterium]|nr:hypothetical protein [Candidatus Kapabacteria bacterium]